LGEKKRPPPNAQEKVGGNFFTPHRNLKEKPPTRALSQERNLGLWGSRENKENPETISKKKTSPTSTVGWKEKKKTFPPLPRNGGHSPEGQKRELGGEKRGPKVEKDFKEGTFFLKRNVREVFVKDRTNRVRNGGAF